MTLAYRTSGTTLPILAAPQLASALVAWTFEIQRAPAGEADWTVFGALAGSSAINGIFGPLAYGAATFVALESRAGRDGPTARAAVSAVRARWASLFLLSFYSDMLRTLGLLACILPGLFVASRVWLGPAVVVVEGRRSRASIGRSWSLVADSGSGSTLAWVAAATMVVVVYCIGAAVAGACELLAMFTSASGATFLVSGLGKVLSALAFAAADCLLVGVMVETYARLAKLPTQSKETDIAGVFS